MDRLAANGPKNPVLPDVMPQGGKRKGGGEGMGGGALGDGAGSTQDAATANPADFACQISQVARKGKGR